MADRTKAPEVYPIPPQKLPELEKILLPNGAGLTILRSHCDTEVFRLSAVHPGGPAFSHAPGVAELYHANLQDGTSTRTSAEIADSIERLGSWFISNRTSHHNTEHLFGLTGKAEEVLPIFADVLRNPVFPDENFRVRQKNMAQQILLKAAKVESVAAKATREAIWPEGHPSAHTNSADDVMRLTTEDLHRFHRHIFRPSEFQFFLAGNITPGLERAVADICGSLEPIDDADNDELIIKPWGTVDSCNDTIRHIDVPGSMQAAISLAVPAIGRDHRDYNMLRLAIVALGGYFGSRLMANLREDKGYTYGISAGLLGSIDGGIVSISTECRADVADAAVKEIRSEFERMLNDPLNADELQRLKGYIMSQQASALDSPFTIIDTAINHLTIGTPEDYYERTNEAVIQATPELLAEVASRHLSLGRAFTAVAGSAQ